MIYFSELKGKKVVTTDGVEMGYLKDFIFLASENPKVTKLIVRSQSLEPIIIPTSYIDRVGEEIKIYKSYLSAPLEENELYVAKNLMDKQIIDLVGHKVVRVNDVTFQETTISGFYELTVLGVDIGLLGIFRWFKLEDVLLKVLGKFNIKVSSQFLSWGDIAPLELARGSVKLKKKEEKLRNIRPEDLADYLEHTNVVNTRKFLKLLDDQKAAGVLNSLNLNYQAEIFRIYKPEKAASLLTLLDSDTAVDIILTLPAKKREQILEYLPEREKKEIAHLLKFSKTQIGNLLSNEFMVVFPDNLVVEVFEKIKSETKDFGLLYNIYVVNSNNQLIGVFNIHELVLQKPDTSVYKFMNQNVIFVYLSTSPEIALKKMIKYWLNTLPVVDDRKNIIGIVTTVSLLKGF